MFINDFILLLYLWLNTNKTTLLTYMLLYILILMTMLKYIDRILWNLILFQQSFFLFKNNVDL
jgi:hypothetical protein